MRNPENIASIQFFRGVFETKKPKIILKRSKDRNIGHALFIFDQPSAFSQDTVSDIKVMILKDKEGETKAKFRSDSIFYGKI